VFTTRPARKSDAAEIALLVNIATHGGTNYGWTADARAGETYSPIEIGRLDMLKDEPFSWRNATIAETTDDEIVGMLLGYREPDGGFDLPADLEPFMVPILQLEAAAKGTWFISMLGVHLPWRSHGVGSLLLDLAEQRAGDTAARGLALIVEDVNERARALYQRRGFSVRTSRPMARYSSGTGAPGKDWLLMVKD